MSTHVDGAAPSVSPDDPERPAGHETGAEWVRAEMQRRMAENRSTRGRHARTAEPAAAVRPDEAPPLTAAGLPRRVRPVRNPAPAPAPEAAAPAELPENYVPRHSVHTPGPAAEPQAPVTGPIPVMRPATGGGPADAGEAPLGGPSLPATGLPVRRHRGPGTPLQATAAPAVPPWTRPTGIVPNDLARRLGAPPETLGTAGPASPWGPPSGTPERPADVPRATPTAPPPDAADTAAVDADAAAASVHSAVDPAVDAAVDTVDTPAEPAVPAPAAMPVNGTARPDADVARPDTDRPDVDPEDTDRPDVTRAADVAAEAAAPAADRPAEVPAETAGEITDEVVDPPTAPHPIVAAQRGTLSGRVVGVPLPRSPEHSRHPARPVAPRPVTPRHIPVVGTAPPEPGSTRVRVVLSERKGIARPVRTIKEVQEGTAVGDLLRRDLIRSQLKVTLRFAALTVLVLGTLPAVLALVPGTNDFTLFGVRVPWLVLGVLMYPFLVGTAWRYARVAERVEQNFADHVQD